MKNYYFSFGKDTEKEDYYLYYEKNNKEITVYLSDGGKKVFDNTRENEIEILNKMENQLRECEDDYINYFKEESEHMIKNAAPFIYISSAISYTNQIGLYSVLNYSVLGIGTLVFSKYAIEYGLVKSTLKDYNKHKLFLDNKELLDYHLRGDFRLLRGINKKAKKEAMRNSSDKLNTLNINTVRLLKYKELKTIIEKAKEQDEKYKNNAKKYIKK